MVFTNKFGKLELQQTGLFLKFVNALRYLLSYIVILVLSQRVRNPTMFSSHVLRRCIENRALFLQCHSHFHAVAIREIQSKN